MVGNVAETQEKKSVNNWKNAWKVGISAHNIQQAAFEALPDRWQIY